jgi:hypothetical protein
MIFDLPRNHGRSEALMAIARISHFLTSSTTSFPPPQSPNTEDREGSEPESSEEPR